MSDTRPECAVCFQDAMRGSKYCERCSVSPSPPVVEEVPEDHSVDRTDMMPKWVKDRVRESLVTENSVLPQSDRKAIMWLYTALQSSQQRAEQANGEYRRLLTALTQEDTYVIERVTRNAVALRSTQRTEA